MYRFFVEPSQVEETVIRICGSDVNQKCTADENRRGNPD